MPHAFLRHPPVFLLAAGLLASSLRAQETEPAPEAFGASLEGQFLKADRNGDEKLSADEVSGRRANLIKSADANGDGGTTLAELRSHLESRKRPPSPDPSAEPHFVEHVFPEEGPVSLASCRAAARYSAGQNGFSFLVMHEGKVIFERYDQGWKPGSAHRLASGTKSFSAAILAAAVKDELLTLDEPVSQVLPEWQTKPRLAAVTYRQLLSLSSGIDPGKVGQIPSYRDAVASAKSEHPPGRKFAYGPAPFQIFGEAIRRKLDARKDLDFADPLAYLEARVFSPIGLSYKSWRRDAEGMPHLPSGAQLTAREWAKYGEFLRRGGTWSGETIVDAATLETAAVGSSANPGYGLTLWRLAPGRGQADPASAPESTDEGTDPWLRDAYMAAGAGKQRLFVIPALSLVVVRQGESTRFDNRTFLRHLIGSTTDLTPGADPSP